VILTTLNAYLFLSNILKIGITSYTYVIDPIKQKVLPGLTKKRIRMLVDVKQL